MEDLTTIINKLNTFEESIADTNHIDSTAGNETIIDNLPEWLQSIIYDIYWKYDDLKFYWETDDDFKCKVESIMALFVTIMIVIFLMYVCK
jgi:hypothetical protein